MCVANKGHRQYGRIKPDHNPLYRLDCYIYNGDITVWPARLNTVVALHLLCAVASFVTTNICCVDDVRTLVSPPFVEIELSTTQLCSPHTDIDNFASTVR